MNANRARPLAAYGLVSLACAAVLVQGMQPTALDTVIGANPGSAASPAAARASTVPGTVLHARATSSGEPVATGPTPTLPGTTIGPLTVTPVSDTPATSGSDDQPRDGSTSSQPTPTPTPRAAAGGASVDRPEGPGKKPTKKPRKGNGHGKGKTSVGRPDTSDGRPGTSPGSGPGKGPGKGLGSQDIRA